MSKQRKRGSMGNEKETTIVMLLELRKTDEEKINEFKEKVSTQDELIQKQSTLIEVQEKSIDIQKKIIEKQRVIIETLKEMCIEEL